MEGVLTGPEAAKQLEIAPETLRKYCRKLGIKKVAGVYVLRPREVDELRNAVFEDNGRRKPRSVYE